MAEHFPLTTPLEVKAPIAQRHSAAAQPHGQRMARPDSMTGPCSGMGTDSRMEHRQHSPAVAPSRPTKVPPRTRSASNSGQVLQHKQTCRVFWLGTFAERKKKKKKWNFSAIREKKNS